MTTRRFGITSNHEGGRTPVYSRRVNVTVVALPATS